MKNLVKRSFSGIIYVAVFITAILCGNFTYYFLTELLIFGALFEFLRIEQCRTGQTLGVFTKSLTYLTAVAFAVYLLFATLLFHHFSEYLYKPQFFLNFLSISIVEFLPILIIIWLIALFYCTFSSKADYNRTLSVGLLSVFYIVLPLSLLDIAYSLFHAKTIILISLIAIWINDTGAYCIGTMFGKHRLCERLSPKKSWEGFWGGMALVIIAGVIYAAVTDQNIFLYAVYGIFISGFATVGDLFESMLKRKAGIKDSGNIIPGHGGVLDRIDSYLFVAYPIIFFTMMIHFLSF